MELPATCLVTGKLGWTGAATTTGLVTIAELAKGGVLDGNPFWLYLGRAGYTN